MKKRHNYQKNYPSPRSEAGLGSRKYQARLRQDINQLKEPLLLVNLPQELVLGLLLDGIQADVCDDSLDHIGSLARACLSLGLKVDLYWQSLAALDLPGRYRGILLSDSAWDSLMNGRSIGRIERRLQDYLTPQGQLALLICQQQFDRPFRLSKFLV